MSSTRRFLAVLISGAALALGAVLPASAAAASSTAPAANPQPANPQAISGCVFRMSTIKALNLRHDGGVDYVFIRLDSTWYPSGNDGVSFVLNQKRTAADFGMPSAGVAFDGSGLPVRVLTDDFPFNHSIDRVVQCAAATNQVVRFDDGDAVYDLTYSVTVVS